MKYDWQWKTQVKHSNKATNKRATSSIIIYYRIIVSVGIYLVCTLLKIYIVNKFFALKVLFYVKKN